MKKTTIIIISLISIILSTAFVYAIEPSIFKIYMNGIETELKQINNDGTIYVPLREYSNMLGYAVLWNETDKSISVKKYNYPMYYAVEENGRYFYTNETGQKLFNKDYEYAEDFSEGLGLVQNDDYTFSFINQDGKEIIDKLYNAESFVNGFALVEEPTEQSDFSYDTYETDGELKSYFIDKSGNKVFNLEFIRAQSFSEGLACVQIDGSYVPQKDSKDLYTYIDLSGEFATTERFEYAGSFNNGKAVVIKDGVKGYIDKTFEFHRED